MAEVVVILALVDNASLADDQLLQGIAGPLDHHISFFDDCNFDVSRKIDHTSEGKYEVLVNERQLRVHLKDIGSFSEEVS